MDSLERELIAKYNTTDREYGYNLESGGHLGKHHSEETKRKISESIKGENHPFFGTHRSEETKQKLRDYHTGLSLSEETKRKISESNKGKQGYWAGKSLSKQHKINIGQSIKGEKNGMYGKMHSEEARKKISEKNSTKIICLETKEVYSSIKEASEAIGLSASAISVVINGKGKTAGKLHWMRLNEYEEKYGKL